MDKKYQKITIEAKLSDFDATCEAEKIAQLAFHYMDNLPADVSIDLGTYTLKLSLDPTNYQNFYKLRDLMDFLANKDLLAEVDMEGNNES